MNHSFHKLPDPDLAASESALDWARSHGAVDRIAERSRIQRRRRQVIRRSASGVVAIAIFAAVGVFWQARQSASGGEPMLPASVVVAVPSRQVLTDGSLVELRDGARINVAYSPTARRVQLLNGEAHFAVAKNKDVPFIVSAGGVEVRAIGTAFAVQLAAKQVEVVVTEGTVAVDQNTTVSPANFAAASTMPAPTLVSAGNRVVVDIAAAIAPPPIVTMSNAEQSDRLSWRVPRIELSGTPLAEALPVFNRYSPVQLSLVDPALGSLEVSGVLRPDNPNALLHVLKVEYGIEADRQANGEIILRRP